jgi:hypothetical protein
MKRARLLRWATVRFGFKLSRLFKAAVLVGCYPKLSLNANADSVELLVT